MGTPCLGQWFLWLQFLLPAVRIFSSWVGDREAFPRKHCSLSSVDAHCSVSCKSLWDTSLCPSLSFFQKCPEVSWFGNTVGTGSWRVPVWLWHRCSSYILLTLPPILRCLGFLCCVEELFSYSLSQRRSVNQWIVSQRNKVYLAFRLIGEYQALFFALPWSHSLCCGFVRGKTCLSLNPRGHYAQRRPCLQVLVVDGKPHMILLEKLVVLLRLNRGYIKGGKMQVM